MESDDEMPTNPGGLYLGPVRRPRKADSEFFDAGNINRALLCKINVFAIISEGGDAMDFDDQPQTFECMFHGCSSRFSSLQRHEAHYETSHRNRCSTCGRSFPTHRLLDLHLSETHDSFFKAMAERRPMYACLVEGCAEVFQTSGKRHKHLVDYHRYPESFDFSRPSYSRKKTRKKIPKGDREKGENRALKAAGTPSKSKSFSTAAEWGVKIGLEPALATTTEATAAADATAGPSGTTFQSLVPSSTNGRRRQQEATNTRPQPVPPLLSAVAVMPRTCKFWRAGAECRAGSSCKFRHDETSAENDGGGGGGGRGGRDPWNDGQRGASAAEVRVAAPVGVGGAVVCGPRERWNPGSADTSGMDAGLSGFGGKSGGVGAALREGMAADDGVDELISGMSKLMVPRRVRAGNSARRGDPIG
eukprot:g7729.t1